MKIIRNPKRLKYLIKGTALELIRWIINDPKALDLEFERLRLIQIEEFEGKCFKTGHMVSILEYLLDEYSTTVNSRAYPLGIAL